MRVIETRFHGATNFHGSRVSARSIVHGEAFGTYRTKRASVHYRHDLNIEENHERAARALLGKLYYDAALHDVKRANDIGHGFYFVAVMRDVPGLCSHELTDCDSCH